MQSEATRITVLVAQTLEWIGIRSLDPIQNLMPRRLCEAPW
jgi:hypothetical protein